MRRALTDSLGFNERQDIVQNFACQEMRPGGTFGLAPSVATCGIFVDILLVLPQRRIQTAGFVIEFCAVPPFLSVFLVLFYLFISCTP